MAPLTKRTKDFDQLMFKTKRIRAGQEKQRLAGNYKVRDVHEELKIRTEARIAKARKDNTRLAAERDGLVQQVNQARQQFKASELVLQDRLNEKQRVLLEVEGLSRNHEELEITANYVDDLMDCFGSRWGVYIEDLRKDLVLMDEYITMAQQMSRCSHHQPPVEPASDDDDEE